MRMARREAAALAALLAAFTTAALGLPPAPVAAAAPAVHADDFNGDGHRDTVAPAYDGGIEVVFGTAHGPGTQTQFVNQDSPGVPGADEPEDEFGRVRQAADFDRDGYGDLAVSVPGEEVDGRSGQGSVVLLWGSPSGLAGGVTLRNTDPGAGKAFGTDLAVGDFDGDGLPDLAAVNGGAVHVHREPGRAGTSASVTKHTRSGFHADQLTAGRVTADGATDLAVVGRDRGQTQTSAWFLRGGSTVTQGATLRLGGEVHSDTTGVIADFDRDGYGDIVVADPRQGTGGTVTVWPGRSSGPGTTVTRLTQSTPGVAGTPENGDFFGRDVSAGDTDRDGYPDLAVGVAFEAIGDVEDAGGVVLFKGAEAGLSGSGSRWFDRGTSGVPGSVTAHDHFGETVRLRDTDGDGRADLWIADQIDALRLRGSSAGVTTTGAVTFSVGADLVRGFLQ